jgi:hypothetical protein
MLDREETLRSKSPHGVAQELWGIGLVYNLSPGTIPKRLRRVREEILRFVLPPRRSQRSYPCAVKIKKQTTRASAPPPRTTRRALSDVPD